MLTFRKFILLIASSIYPLVLLTYISTCNDTSPQSRQIPGMDFNLKFSPVDYQGAENREFNDGEWKATNANQSFFRFENIFFTDIPFVQHALFRLPSLLKELKVK